MIQDAASQKTEGFQFWSLDCFAVYIYGARTLNRAAQAALVYNIIFFGQRFAADHIKVIKLTVIIVFGGKLTAHLHDGHQPCSSHAWKLVSGKRVFAEIAEPGLI